MSVPQLVQQGDFPPEGSLFAVSSVHLQVRDAPHPWYVGSEQAVADNWVRESTANPHLFNGSMVLQREVRFDQGRIRGEGHVVSFATFLHWRKSRAPGCVHLFAMPLILTKDGALLAIRMAASTANPGRVYCAAGSMDGADIFDGVCDLEHNMRREVLEETGLDLRDAQADAEYFATHIASVIAVTRVFRFDRSAEELLALVGQHIASDPEPEIETALAIRSADPAAHDYPPFMIPILTWLFPEQAGSDVS